ncbi:MAG: DNA-binding protein [Sphingobacteriales bacterium]|nr:MAG: DNA-binding protein [Sphingobacteriales bacterium]
MKKIISNILLVFLCFQLLAQKNDIERVFKNPPASAKPWVFWYWMHGAVSKEGITADLEAMKQVGIGGAYLMPIKDTNSKISFEPQVRQLTPQWWALVSFALAEAQRLNLKIGMHVSDGFALAGGPWITPQLSMQKLVWTKTFINAANKGTIICEQPQGYDDYYKDIAVFAYPAKSVYAFSDVTIVPTVLASNGTKPQYLSFNDPMSKEVFRSDTSCWIQYKYPVNYTCRSVRIHCGTNSYQAQRLLLQISDDGINFKNITRLEPPRHGWQDTEQDYTHSIPVTTARYFRFVYNKEGTEPGAEDLDAAKWKPSLRVMGIYLDDEPVINQYEAKNGSVWRVAANTTANQVNDKDAVPLNSVINLTDKLDADGNLNWTPPAGNWVVVRMGHTSTGLTNYTGGGGLGLECDKFNATAVTLQFNNWFGKVFEQVDSNVVKDVLKVFHIDSWECGSQNWSENFAGAFKEQHGYDLMNYLLVMTGVPVESVAVSEKVLHDVRETIATLVNDVFYETLKKLAHEKGCVVSAESVAPTMVSDGLLHYRNTDLPMGEFWLNSPTHDKLNDMLDAVSGAHIYGKNIIQAESFTSVRMNWAEHPGGLKVLGDRNFALGINKLVLHVFTHNPWMQKQPGMTLDGVGLYYQRNQTWFAQSKVWIEYLSRCQALLQLGKPVVDIAVFTGEEVPRRAILPSRLVNTLPGLFGKEKVEVEKKRLQNEGQPQRSIPDGVTHAANMTDPENWIDPLNGYTYDSFNPDVLLQLFVENGAVVAPGGVRYKILVLPARHALNPNNSLVSEAVLQKLIQLLKAGATIIMSNDYVNGIGMKDRDGTVRLLVKELLNKTGKKGKLIIAPYTDSSLAKLGVVKDVDVLKGKNTIAWTHRKETDADIYFIANQAGRQQVAVSFNNSAKPMLIHPVTGVIKIPQQWSVKGGRVILQQTMEAGESFFIVFRMKALTYAENTKNTIAKTITIKTPWSLKFDEQYGGKKETIVLNELHSWTEATDTATKFYSGPVVYTNSFWMDAVEKTKQVQLQVEALYNIATIKINGIDCGTLWTPPYTLNITNAVKRGNNTLEIIVTNTWHNRLIADQLLPIEKRITYTIAPFRLKDKPLQPAGIIGTVQLILQ